MRGAPIKVIALHCSGGGAGQWRALHAALGTTYELVTPERMTAGVADGAYVRAAQSFVDYWSGSGAWTTLRASARSSVIRWVTKAPLEFHALIAPDAARPAYATLDCPTLIMRGEHAPLPTRLIADALQTCMPRAWREVVEGAGHMGPLTHSATVNALVGRHIARSGFEGHAEREVSPTGPGELLATI